MNYSQFDYYFRVEYTIIESACQPVYTFQSSETIDSLEQIVNKNLFVFFFIFEMIIF